MLNDAKDARYAYQHALLMLSAWKTKSMAKATILHLWPIQRPVRAAPIVLLFVPMV